MTRILVSFVFLFSLALAQINPSGGAGAAYNANIVTTAGVSLGANATSTLLNLSSGGNLTSVVLRLSSAIATASSTVNLQITVDGGATTSFTLWGNGGTVPNGAAMAFESGSASGNTVGDVFRIPFNVTFKSSLVVALNKSGTGTDGAVDVTCIYGVKQ